MTNRQPPKQLVRNLLRENWDAANNTFNFKPSIQYGWFDSYETAAYVIVRQPDENPAAGGETGWTGRTASGPWREVDGVCPIHIFASDRKIKDNGTVTTDHAGEYVWGADAADDGTLGDRGAVRNVERILGDNEVQPTDPITGNEPVRYLSINPSTPQDEPDSTGPFFHHVIEAAYRFGE